jgi:hypothetical protein
MGTEHPRYATYEVNLGRAYLMRHEAKRAEPLLRHALAFREKTFPPSDWRIAQVKSVLGGVLLEQKRYAEAETLMLAAREGLRPVPGPQANEAIANAERLKVLSRTIGR